MRETQVILFTPEDLYSLTVYSGGILAPNPKAGNILSLEKKISCFICSPNEEEKHEPLLPCWDILLCQMLTHALDYLW